MKNRILNIQKHYPIANNKYKLCLKKKLKMKILNYKIGNTNYKYKTL